MKLYLGNRITAVTSVLLIGLIIFIFYTYTNRGNISYWGRRTLVLGIYGWIICCLAAERDGLDKTIQCAIDQSCSPGIFSLVSVPTIIGCVGAAMILFAAIGTLCTKSQHVREIMFFLMSGGVGLKVITIEIAKVFIRFS